MKRYVKAKFYFNNKVFLDLIATINKKSKNKVFNFDAIEEIYFIKQHHKKNWTRPEKKSYVLDFLKAIFNDKDNILLIETYYSENRFIKQYFNMLIK